MGGRRERKPSASAAGWAAPQAAANPFSSEKLSRKKHSSARLQARSRPRSLFWVERIRGRGVVGKRWRRGRRCDVAAMKRQRLILKRAAGPLSRARSCARALCVTQDETRGHRRVIFLPARVAALPPRHAEPLGRAKSELASVHVDSQFFLSLLLFWLFSASFFFFFFWSPETQ